jgi:hypothetical protein
LTKNHIIFIQVGSVIMVNHGSESEDEEPSSSACEEQVIIICDEAAKKVVEQLRATLLQL